MHCTYSREVPYELFLIINIQVMRRTKDGEQHRGQEGGCGLRAMVWETVKEDVLGEGAYCNKDVPKGTGWGRAVDNEIHGPGMTGARGQGNELM